MPNEILFEGSNSQSSKITSANNNNFVTLLNPLELLQNKINTINNLYHYDCSFKIESFRLLINIESLGVAPFPDIYPEDSAGVRNQKLLNTEFHNPNFIFRMFKQQNNIDYEMGDIYVQNKGMQYNKSILRPYLIDGNIPVKLWGLNNILKVRIFDSGYGLLGLNDYLQIELDYSYIITGLTKVGFNVVPRNIAKTINSVSPQKILDANLNRVKLSFKNEGESIVSFAFGKSTDCVIGSSPELKPGESFNDESIYPYQQALWAIAHEDNAIITGIEGII